MLAEKPISLAQHVIHHLRERPKDASSATLVNQLKKGTLSLLLASVEESEDHDTLLALEVTTTGAMGIPKRRHSSSHATVEVAAQQSSHWLFLQPEIVQN